LIYKGLYKDNKKYTAYYTANNFSHLIKLRFQYHAEVKHKALVL